MGKMATLMYKMAPLMIEARNGHFDGGRRPPFKGPCFTHILARSMPWVALEGGPILTHMGCTWPFLNIGESQSRYHLLKMGHFIALIAGKTPTPAIIPPPSYRRLIYHYSSQPSVPVSSRKGGAIFDAHGPYNIRPKTWGAAVDISFSEAAALQSH